jgi:predicted nucleic acid-binding protein
MVTALVDSSILVDALRHHPPAIEWVRSQRDLGVTQIVWLELIEGAQNKRKLITLIQFLSMFERIQIVSADLEWAIEQSIRYRLSHSIGMMDCLIASVSARLQIPIYTGNLKHFEILIGQLAQKPY